MLLNFKKTTKTVIVEESITIDMRPSGPALPPGPSTMTPPVSRQLYSIEPAKDSDLGSAATEAEILPNAEEEKEIRVEQEDEEDDNKDNVEEEETEDKEDETSGNRNQVVSNNIVNFGGEVTNFGGEVTNFAASSNANNVSTPRSRRFRCNKLIARTTKGYLCLECEMQFTNKFNCESHIYRSHDL